MVTSIFIIVSHLSYSSLFDILSHFCMTLSRYIVSLASLRPIFILFMKSFLLHPDCASDIFALMLVHDLNACEATS